MSFPYVCLKPKRFSLPFGYRTIKIYSLGRSKRCISILSYFVCLYPFMHINVNYMWYAMILIRFYPRLVCYEFFYREYKIVSEYVNWKSNSSLLTWTQWWWWDRKIKYKYFLFNTLEKKYMTHIYIDIKYIKVFPNYKCYKLLKWKMFFLVVWFIKSTEGNQYLLHIRSLVKLVFWNFSCGKINSTLIR